jgi:allantoinase
VAATLAIRSARVVFPGGVRPAALHIRDGLIDAIRPHDDWPAGVPRHDAGDLVILPGIVDTHVHINEPGRTEWEGFEHATRAAAAGGVTTLVDMPLNSVPPTSSVEGLGVKRTAAEGRCFVDVGFWGGLVPGNAAALEPLARAGVLGFKCFLSPSGVPEFQHVDEADLRSSMPILARLGLPLLVHAELPVLLREPAGDARQYSTWLESRPPAAEHAAIDLMIRLARETGAHVHIVHLASPEALAAISEAKAAGVTITVETCPHYLTFAAEEIGDGATAFKCAPPIRSGRDRDGLWRGLAAGAIDLVATDHSPSPPALKLLDSGDFVRAWGGIASLQVGLGAVWTGALAGHIAAFDYIAEWMAAAPAKLAGLQRSKGSITVGSDADLVVWDPDGSTRVDPATWYSRHPTSPYAGLTLDGRVHQTLLRGSIVFDADTGHHTTPLGRTLSKAR